jgi:hypothetical protein
VTVATNFYPTLGHPFKALVTANDRYVLVSLGCDVPSGALACHSLQAGVQVLERPDFTNPCGEQNIIQFDSRVTNVDGMSFFPPSPLGLSVGAAVELQGAEFFNLRGGGIPCHLFGKDNPFNVQQPPIERKKSAPGSIDLAVTPNAEYAFVANEYQTAPGNQDPLGGTIGVISVKRNSTGGFTGTGPITSSNQPVDNIFIPGADTIPSITMSHDGKHLYVANEEASSKIDPLGNPYWDPTNVRSSPNGKILASQNCQNQGPGSAIKNNGLLTIVDVDSAINGDGQGSIMTIIASGCGTGRVVETADGKYIWVTARGLNLNLGNEYQVLAFDVKKLLSKRIDQQNDALVGYGDSGGTAPVGMALFDNDQMLAVANSNRFEANPKYFNPPVASSTTNVAILDVSNPKAPGVITKIPPKTPNPVNSFPREVTLGPLDGTDCKAELGCFTLYVTNWETGFLEVITAHLN